VVALFRRGFVSAWGTMDPKTALLPFWLLPISNFGSSLVTEFITTSHMFTLLPSLVPYRAMLAVPPPPHGFGFNPFGVGYIVRGASDPAITGHACPPRLLPGKRQVSLTNSCYETITYTTSRRTSGRNSALLHRSPLRTGLASFPASGSSLFKAPFDQSR